MSTDLETNLLIIEEFTQRLQVAVIGAEETTDKHVNWVEGPVDGTIETANGPLKTLRGQIAEWRLAADQDVASAINGYDTQFAAKLVEFQEEFEAYLITIGFEPAVEYSAGIVISRRAQTVVFGGVTYYWVSTLPYTTTGSFGTETGWQIAPIVGGIEVPTFNFSTGGKLLRKTQSVLGLDGEWYFWTGPFPKTITAGSTLESAGGVGENLFKIASGQPPMRPTFSIIATSIGYTLNAGSFESGATITEGTSVLVQFLTGKMYRWDGVLPKVVDLNSTPSSSGGIVSGGWTELNQSYANKISRESLRRSYAEAGYNLRPEPESFENGGTVATATDVLLYEANGHAYNWNGVFPGGGKVVPQNSTPASAGGVGVGKWLSVGDITLRSEIESDRPWVSPEMYGATPAKSLTDTAAILATFTAARALGVNVKLSRRYDCTSNITIVGFVSEVFGVNQGECGIDFGAGFGFVIDNSGLTVIRKPVKFSSLTLRTSGNGQGVAIDFTGVRFVRYGPQLECRSITITSADDVAGSFEKAFKLYAAGEALFDFVTVSGAPSNKMPVVFDLHSSKDVKVVNGSFSDFQTFLDAHDDTEGVVVAFSHVIAGYRGVVSRDNVGNLFTIIGNHFNTSISAVSLGEGSGNGSNHCKISDNFCIVFNAPEHISTPYVGFDICSNHNSLSGNEVLLTGFTKDCTNTVLRGNLASTRFATANSISKPIATQLTRNVHVKTGATNNHVYGNIRTGLSLTDDIIDEGTNTRFWLLDSNNNALLTKDINLGNLGVPGTRQISAFTTSDTAVASGILRFIGGVAGVANDAVLESTCRETVTKLIRPSVGNTYNCGASGAPWSGGFTQTAFTVTSDERTKTRPFDITDAMLDAAAEIDLVMFQIIGRILEKGEENARWHVGVIAQRVKEIFERHGVDAHEHAFFCHDTWDHEPAVIVHHPATYDFHGMALTEAWEEIVKEEVHAGELYSIRYEELLVLKVKQIERDNKRNIDNMTARIEELEARL